MFMGNFFQCKWQRPLERVVMLLHLDPFWVMPMHWVAVVEVRRGFEVEDLLLGGKLDFSSQH